MHFPYGLKVEGCAAKEQGRYAMHGVKVERCEASDERPGFRAVATNGRVLAIVPLTGSEADDVYGQIVPLDALKLARKVAGAKREADVVVNGACVAGGQTFQPIEGEFPRWRAVVPAPAPETHYFVTLDADYLRDVCDAIARANREGSRAVTLCVSREHNTSAPVLIVARPNDCGSFGGVGVVMPITLDDDTDKKGAERLLDAVRAAHRWAVSDEPKA